MLIGYLWGHVGKHKTNEKCASHLISQSVEWMQNSDYCDGMRRLFFCGNWKYITLKDKVISFVLTPPQSKSTTQVKKIYWQSVNTAFTSIVLVQIFHDLKITKWAS
jgi:hypothetical protein